MGSVIYDFLADSFLFNESLLNDTYSSVSEEDLKKEIENYRENVLSNIGELKVELESNDCPLRIFGAKDYFSVPNLMQTALYFDQVILPDPIFPFSHSASDASRTMSDYLGLKESQTLDRKSLVDAVRKMKKLTPMVAANYLKFFPVSYYSEPNEIFMTYSENAYSDGLPAEILSAYRNNANVRSVRKSEQGWFIDNSLQVGRGITVQFKDDGDDKIYIYYLLSNEIVNYDGETGVAQVAMKLPDEPPPPDQFMAWVNQSINQSAINHFTQVVRGLKLSGLFNASLLTTSEFTQSLLGSKSSIDDIPRYTSECVLNINLPFLFNVSIENLMCVRQNDGEAFELFRRELERTFRELRTENNPERLKRKIQNAIHELTEVQVVKIDQQFKEVRKGALGRAVIGLAGLAGTVVGAGWSIAATALALANGYTTYSDYRQKIRGNPAYFLWKVISK